MADKGHDNIAYESGVCEAVKTNQREQTELNHIEFVTRNDYTSEKETNGWWVEIIHQKVRGYGV